VKKRRKRKRSASRGREKSVMAERRRDCGRKRDGRGDTIEVRARRQYVTKNSCD